MSVSSRLSRIEKSLSAAGGCWTCADAMPELLTLWDDDPQPPPTVCPECGAVRHRTIIVMASAARTGETNG